MASAGPEGAQLVNQFGNRGIGGYGARMGLGPAVFLLLLSNVAVFILQFLLAGFSGYKI